MTGKLVSRAGAMTLRGAVNCRRSRLFGSTALMPVAAALAGGMLLLAPGQAYAQSLPGVGTPSDGSGSVDPCLDANETCPTGGQTSLVEPAPSPAESSPNQRSALRNVAIAPLISITPSTITYADGEVFSGGIVAGSNANLNIVTGTATQAGMLSGRSYNKIGLGTLIFTANNNYIDTTISEGTLQIGNGGTTGTLGTGDVVNNAALVFNRSDDIVVGNAISGTGSLTQLGAGVLTLTGDNSYSGETIVSNGTLQIGNGGTTGTLGSGGIVLGGGRLTFNRSDNITVANSITGSGDLVQAGSGTLTLTGANTQGGNTFIRAGTLALGNLAALGKSTINLSGGTLQSNVSGTLNNYIETLAGSVSTIGAADGTSLVLSSGALIFRGHTIFGSPTLTGTVSIADDSPVSLLDVGRFDIAGGTFRLSGQSAALFSVATELNVGTGTTTAILDANGISDTLLNVSGTSAGIITNNGGTASNLTLRSLINTQFAGQISNGTSTLGLTKTGSGTLTLTGANTYSGGTTINAGTLVVGNNSALGTGALTMGANTRLLSGGTGDRALANNIVLNGAGISIGNPNAGTSLTLGGIISGGAGLTVTSDTGTLVLTGANTYSGGTTIAGNGVFGGTLQLGSGALAGSLGSGNVTINTGARLIANSSANQTIAGALSGAGSLTQMGSGTLTLNSASTGFSGVVFLNAGAIQVAGGNALGTGGLAFLGGDLVTTTTLTMGNTLSFGGGNNSRLRPSAGTVLTLTGLLEIGGDFRASGGAGSTIRVNSSSVNIIAPANVIVESGTLSTSTGGLSTVISNVSGETRIDSGATLDLNGSFTQIRNLQGAGTLLNGSETTVLLGGNFSGQIGGAQSIVIDGDVSLSGNSTYTGTTTVQSGTLTVRSSNALGTAAGGTTVNSGATLQFGATALGIADALTISGNGSAGVGALRVVNTSGTVDQSTVLTGSVSLAADATVSITDRILLSMLGPVQLGASNLTVTSDGTGNSTVRISGTISGTGGLIKNNPGVLDLIGTNTFTGPLTINGGEVILASGAALADTAAINTAAGTRLFIETSETIGSLAGAGTVGLLNNSILTMGGDNASTTQSGNITNNGGLTKVGTGTFTLTGTSSAIGTTTNGAGALQIGDGGTTGAITGGPIVNNASLIFNRSNALTHSSVISGTGSLTKLGAGNLTLTGANTYSGGTIISGGTLTVGTAGALGTGGLLLNGGNLTLNAAQTVGFLAGTSGLVTIAPTSQLIVDQNSDTTFGGSFAASGAVNESYLRKLGTGTLTLSGNNTQSGVGRIFAGGGTLVLQGGNAVGDANILEVSNATARLGSDETIGGLLGISTGILDTNGFTLTIAGTPGTTGTNTAVNVAGTGTFRLNGADFTTGMSGSHTLAGTYRISAGRLQLRASNVLSNAASLLIDGGVIDLTGFTDEVGSITLQTGEIRTTTAGATIASLGTYGQSGGVISTGATVVATGLSTLSGGTIAGTLRANGGALLNSGIVTVNGLLQGNVNLAAGTLRLGGTNNVVGTITTTGSVIDFADGASSNAPIVVNSNTTQLQVTTGSATQSGNISEIGGARPLEKIGAGGLLLAGTNTFTGPLNITGGTLGLTGGSALADNVAVNMAAGTGLVVDTSETIGSLAGNGAISIASADTLTTGGNNASTTFTGIILGAGSLAKTGTGTFTLAGDNLFTGTTTISGGTLQIGNGGTTGTLGSGIVSLNAGAELRFNRSDAVSVANQFAGEGTIAKNLANTLSLTGSNTAASSFTGTVNVNAGSLLVNGTFGDLAARSATINVLSGGTLGGSGTIQGNVTVEANGILAPGTSAGTQTIAGNLTLQSGAFADFELAQVGVVGGGINDLVNVGGDLTLAGALRVTALPGFSAGYYRLFNYGGTLTNNGLTIGTTPAGFTGELLTNIAGQVNVLFNSGGQLAQYWDGSDLTGALATINGEGGAGTWNASSTNWASPTGFNVNGAWGGQLGIFAGAAGGLVSVSGSQAFQELRFQTDGYTLRQAVLGSGSLATTGGFSIIDVASGVNATIALPIFGTAGLTKTGAGTLTLDFSNIYTGATTIAAGTLQIGNGGLTGSLNSASAIINNGTLIYNRSNLIVVGNTISGTGAVRVTGPGFITLTGNNSYGATFIDAGTLQVGNGGTSGTLGTGTVTNNGQLFFNRSDVLTVSNAISGTGRITNTGSGTVVLTGANSHAGGTTLLAGQVIAASDSALGASSSGTTVNAGATLGLQGGVTIANALAVGGQGLGGTGALRNISGNNTVSGPVSWSVATRINSDAGLLTLNGALTGSGSSTMTVGGAGNTRINGVISGAGGLTKDGSGTLTLAGANTFTGTTTVSSGTLQVLASGSLASPVTNNAMLINAGTISGAVVNSGVLGSSGVLNRGLVNNATGTAFVSGQINADIINQGSVTLTGATTGIANVNQSAGTINLNGFDTTFQSLAGAGGTIELGTANLTLLGTGFLSTTFDGTITGSGGLIKNGPSAFSLSRAQGYTGLTTVNAGSLIIGAAGSLAGAVQNNARVTNNGTIAGLVANGGVLTSTGTLAAGLTNAVGGTVNLRGTLNGVLANAGTVSLSGAVAGITTLSQSATGVTNLFTFDTTVGALTGSGAVNATTAILTVGGSNESSTFAGTIAGSGGLRKVGTGTLTLTGVNSFAGLTLIEAGRLSVGGSLAGAVTNNAAFDLTGGFVGGVVTNNGQLISVGELRGGLVNNAGARAVLGSLVGGDIANAGTVVLDAGTTGIGAVSQSAGGVFDLGAGDTVIASLAGAGSVLLGARTLTVGGNGPATSFAGVISGSGGLIKQGAGGLTLAGVNTYTGLTAVEAGTLAIAAGGAIGGDVLNTGTLDNGGSIGGGVRNSGTLANSGAIAGLLINEAAGSASNTGAIGGGVINRGTLVSTGTIGTGLDNAGSARIAGAANGFVSNAGTIVLTGTTSGIVSLDQTGAGSSFDLGGFDTSLGALSGTGRVTLGAARLSVGSLGANTSFAGIIAGSGGLTKVGTGALILTGANSYSGGTTISGGILQLGDGSTSGSIAGPVVNNGTFIANRSDAFSLANVISGTGMFVQNGTGTTTLSAANSYTGGTLVARGRLIGNTTSLQGLIQIDPGAALEFAQGAAGSFGGSLIGAGLFEKTGAGLLTLTGNSNGFAGATAVRAGELRITGELARSLVTVGTGATLSGTGVIGGLVAQSGSTIAPGTSPGTLGVAGNVTLQAGSTTVFEVSATGPSDLIVVTGSAALGGTAALVSLGGTHAFNRELVLMQADGGRTGTFANVTGTTAFGIIYRPELVYTGSQVRLRLAPNSLASILGGSSALAGLTANQRAVVTGIDAAVAAGYNPQPLFAVYSLPTAQFGNAFDQLSGEVYATAAGVGIGQERLVREAVLGRLSATAMLANEAPEYASGLGVWGQVYGGWGKGDRRASTAAFDADRMGFVTGLDFGKASENGSWRAGVFGMQVQSDVTIAARGSAAEVEQAGGGAYGALTTGGFGVSLGGYLAAVDLRARRNIAITGFADNLAGTTRGTARQGFAEVSYTLEAGAAQIRQFVSGSIGSFALDGLTERGGPAALAMRQQRYNTGSLTWGIDARVPVGKVLRFDGTLAARRQLGDRDPQALMALAAAPGQTFAIEGTQLDRTAFAGRLDAVFQFDEHVAITLGYTGLIGKTQTDHGARATVSVRF